MDEVETITPEYEEMKEEYEMKINDDILRIEMNNDKIKFILIIGISYKKYIKEVYEYLIKSEYEIKKKRKE